MRSNFSKYFLMIMSFVFLGYLINAYIDKRDAGQRVIPEEEAVKKCTVDNFKVIDIQWPKEGQEARGIIHSITVTNSGDYDCNDMRGVMRFLSNEGTELGMSDFTVSEKIRSKETKTFKNIILKPPAPYNANNASVTIEGSLSY